MSAGLSMHGRRIDTEIFKVTLSILMICQLNLSRVLMEVELHTCVSINTMFLKKKHSIEINMRSCIQTSASEEVSVCNVYVNIYIYTMFLKKKILK